VTDDAGPPEPTGDADSAGAGTPSPSEDVDDVVTEAADTQSPDRETSDEDEPVRVLWLIKGLGPGGAEQLLVNQAKVRDTDRFDYQAAYLVPWKHHLTAELADAGVGTTCLDGPKEWDLRWAWRLRRHLATEPVDVVHNHSPYVAAVTRLLVRTLPKDRRPALVYTEHNRWPRHARATRLLNRLTFGLDDAQLSVSDDVRDTIPPNLARAVETLVHGVVLDDVRAASAARPEVRAELGITDDEVVVGIVANFRKEKAYGDWLAAAGRALETSDVPLRFVSVGQGPLEDEMRAHHAELGLGDRVLLLGYRDDAVRVMSAFDVFSLASLHEGLPVSLMDALALGLPVVATAVGGIPQAVTDGVEAVLVPPQQPGPLADAMVAVAADPERRAAMSEAALARSEAFDIAAATRHLEAVYARTAAARQRTAPT
jgi:glycosyltransferase involved in cell wall biosynthesis